MNIQHKKKNKSGLNSLIFTQCCWAMMMVSQNIVQKQSWEKMTIAEIAQRSSGRQDAARRMSAEKAFPFSTVYREQAG